MFAYTHSSPVLKYDSNGTDDKEYTYNDLRTFDFLEGMYLNCTYKGTSENNKQFTTQTSHTENSLRALKNL